MDGIGGGRDTARERYFLEVAPGVLLRTEAGDAAFRAVVEALQRAGRTPATTVLAGPAVVPKRLISETDYLTAFPQLLGFVHAFAGDRRAHLGLLREAAKGEEWSTGVHDTDLALAPAACHVVYDLLRDSDVADRAVEILSPCYRHEPSEEDTRLRSFTMLEYVYVGSADGAAQFAAAWPERARAALSSVGLDTISTPACDPFFGTAAAVRAFDPAASAKHELVAETDAGAVAVASVNHHRDHFGRNFSITSGGDVAHSACVGFGIERIMMLAALRD